MDKRQVVLIGDSIRMGYQDVVARELADVADVWGPAENGGTTPNVLVFLHAWVLNRQPPPDLVHINAGLHDLKTIYYGGRQNVVPLAHYRRNVETLLATIRERTAARILWATTTPIVFARTHAAHAQWRDFDRYEEDIVAYNRAAVAVCRRLRVPVNDLYDAVMRAGHEPLLNQDGVHFTDEGREFLGQTVARNIRQSLQTPATGALAPRRPVRASSARPARGARR
jgi:lysophospholipase L1-like esterase